MNIFSYFFKKMLKSKKPVRLNPKKVPSFPFSAVWRNDDHDIPVVIVEYAGEMNNEHYFYRQDSKTGLPASQLFLN